MKIDDWTHLVDRDGYSESDAYKAVVADIREAMKHVVWPPGSDKFTIYPESGKKSGHGNGVGPIKTGLTTYLKTRGWELEARAPAAKPIDGAEAVRKGSQPGAFDCHFTFEHDTPKPFVIEWETGNVSSSHRAINRIALGLLKGYVSGGVLMVPSRKLAPWLTDRIGNAAELTPYHELWRTWTFPSCYLGIVTVEQDAESLAVPRIPKGTDGRALG